VSEGTASVARRFAVASLALDSGPKRAAEVLREAQEAFSVATSAWWRLSHACCTATAHAMSGKPSGEPP
jgi:hypothetical protein